MENNKREIYFLNILIPEALSIEIATQTNEYAWKHIEQLRQHQTKLVPNQCRGNQGFSSL
jgi:hypothetical protein